MCTQRDPSIVTRPRQSQETAQAGLLTGLPGQGRQVKGSCLAGVRGLRELGAAERCPSDCDRAGTS